MKENKVFKLFLVLMFVGVPLIITKGYKNIVQTKIIYLSVIAICFSFYFFCKKYVSYIEQNHGKVSFFKDFISYLEITDVCVFTYVFFNLIACLFAKYRGVSFSGITDGYIGLYYVFILSLVYWLFRICKEETSENLHCMTKLITLGANISIIFSFLQFWGFDIFNLISNLNTDHVNNYLSLFGNTGVFGEYIILTIPVTIAGYLMAIGVKDGLFYGISIFISIIGILLANTDATYLGFVIIVVVYICFVIRNKKDCSRFIEFLSISLLTTYIFGILYDHTTNVRSVSVITSYIIHMPLSYFVIGIGLLFVLYMINIFIKTEDYPSVIQRILIVIFALLFIGILVLFINFSVFDRQTNIGKFANYLRFSKEWGTQRGYVWTWLWQDFKEFSLGRKVFGLGQGTVIFDLLENHMNEMMNELKYTFDNAHNVYLHQLITIGIAGLAAYIGIILSCIMKFLNKKCVKNNFYIGFFIAIIAYSIQDLVCVFQPMTLFILFIYFSILQSATYNYAQNLTKKQ